MNLDAVGMLVITTVLGLVTTTFWRWVSGISDTSKENGKKIEEVKTDIANFKLDISEKYQSKEDAHKDIQLIMETLKEIKVDVKEVSNKLDKKADKP